MNKYHEMAQHLWPDKSYLMECSYCYEEIIVENVDTDTEAAKEAYDAGWRMLNGRLSGNRIEGPVCPRCYKLKDE